MVPNNMYLGGTPVCQPRPPHLSPRPYLVVSHLNAGGSQCGLDPLRVPPTRSNTVLGMPPGLFLQLLSVSGHSQGTLSYMRSM